MSRIPNRRNGRMTHSGRCNIVVPSLSTNEHVVHVSAEVAAQHLIEASRYAA